MAAMIVRFAARGDTQSQRLTVRLRSQTNADAGVCAGSQHADMVHL
jgi:hypothetical protein